jgi:hypothetical protein
VDKFERNDDPDEIETAYYHGLLTKDVAEGE